MVKIMWTVNCYSKDSFGRRFPEDSGLAKGCTDGGEPVRPWNIMQQRSSKVMRPVHLYSLLQPNTRETESCVWVVVAEMWHHGAAGRKAVICSGNRKAGVTGLVKYNRNVRLLHYP